VVREKGMDFVFMLTRGDRTVEDALDVLDDVRSLGLQHVGFKDVGVPPQLLGELARRIHAMGATSYLEIVSTTAEECRAAASLARELGIDRLLGGSHVEDVLEVLSGSPVRYLPFAGRPFDHPTKLGGSVELVAEHCRRYEALGCAGVDLLAFRAIEANPLDLVQAARRATQRTLLVAGGIQGPEQVRALAAAGVDAFTVGSAVFDGTFAPSAGSVRAQLAAVLEACRA
jgi:hypothetical protein